MADGSMPVTAEALAAHLGWARRLAAHLVRDPEEADDVVQEAWIAGWRNPPEGDRPLRPWLGQVLVNRVRNRLRADRRRAARELNADDVSGPAPAATPEELATRLELQRTLAQRLLALPEGYQQVLYLRYYEGLDATAIGARLAIPPGTVRWRLKSGLDQLRAQLDAEHGGERKRWVRLLVPLAGVARPGPLLLRPLVAIPLAALLLLALGGFLEYRRRARMLTQQHLNEVILLPEVAPPLPPPRPPTLPASAAGALSPPASCPQANALRAETAELRRELGPYLRPDTILAEAPPNPELERRFGAALALDQVGKCGHRLECRGDACRLTLLVPLPAKETERCFPSGFRLRDYVGSRIWGGSGDPVWDPVAGLPLTRVQSSYRMASPDGSPIPFERQPPRPPLTIVRHRPAPPLPASATPACRTAYEEAVAEREALERLADRDLDADVAFGTNAPEPATTAEATRHVERMLGPDLAGRLQVECRGPVCRVTPRDPSDPSTAIAWDCHDGGLCLPAADEQAWFRRLAPRNEKRPFWKRSSRGPLRTARGEILPHYQLLPVEDRDKPDGMTILQRFVEPLRRSRLIEECERRFPATGRLAFTLELTATDAEGRSHIEAHYGEALGGSPLARCIADGVDAARASFTVPPHTGGATIKAKLDFPGARQGGR
jgi:RNA polymerase sigma factor (sigma-70 family)